MKTVTPVRILFSIALAIPAMAQTPTETPVEPGPVGGGIIGDYPQRPPGDPASVARGRALYGVNCGFCHGSDARGGEGGPNLLRAELVLNDRKGELIAPVVQNGRPDRGMPALKLSMPQIVDVAAFVHSFRVGGYDLSRMKPPNIVVGDAKAGEAYFQTACAACHSVTGDLKGIGAKLKDPMTLQNNFLMPGTSGGRGDARGGAISVPPTMVTVTPEGGVKVEGRLVWIDDFTVTLTLSAGGMQRTFRRDGETPKVEIHDPLQPHQELLRRYTDADIHNLTAYLVTVK